MNRQRISTLWIPNIMRMPTGARSRRPDFQGGAADCEHVSTLVVMTELNQSKAKGFTLIELLVVIGITLMITTLALSNFRRYQAQRSVEGALEITLAQITRAHLDTISSRNDTSYGVHFENDRITYFAGTSFDSSDSRDIVQQLPSGTELINLALNGGGQDIKFKRVTGDTNQWGTFTLRSTSFPTTMKTITVNSIGTIVY